MPFIKNVAIFARKVTPSAPVINDNTIDAGHHSVFISGLSGRAWGWGNNNTGQLGDNSTTSRRTPVSVLGAAKTFCKISASVCHTIAIDKNGRVWAWGWNVVGQLGDNSTATKLTPVSVLGAAKTFCQIASGRVHTLAIEKNGRVWAWGFNSVGQLGDNTIISKNTPVSILGAAKTFCKISAGSSHTLAIDKNGRVWAWGNNSAGQLGDNSTTSKLTPVSVLGAAKTFCQIQSGDFHAVALDKNGRVWAWGLNDLGQLGDNSITNRCTPVSIAGAAKTFCKIASSGKNTVAIDKNGRVWTWGDNTFGQLGDNSVTSRLTPVSVLGAAKTFCQIASGYSDFGEGHTLAIEKDGKVWAWGGNSRGQLGNNSVTSTRTPVRVCNL
jgi:alpha-tubulin suppressor-like RCC1 family protein